MGSGNRLRALLRLEWAAEAAARAESMMNAIDEDVKDVMGTPDLLEIQYTDINNLRMQVAMARQIVEDADAIVKTTEKIVAEALRAVELARKAIDERP